MSTPTQAATRSRFGDAVLLLFLGTQVTDGALTYVGILSFGTHIEANPIVSWYVGVLGVGAAIVSAKVFATLCALTLHVRERHRTLAFLSLVYLAAAVWPWIRVLSEIQ